MPYFQVIFLASTPVPGAVVETDNRQTEMLMHVSIYTTDGDVVLHKSLVAFARVLLIRCLLPPGSFFQFWTIRQGVTQSTTNRASLVRFSLCRSWISYIEQELWDLLLGLDQQVLEIE